MHLSNYFDTAKWRTNNTYSPCTFSFSMWKKISIYIFVCIEDRNKKINTIRKDICLCMNLTRTCFKRIKLNLFVSNKRVLLFYNFYPFSTMLLRNKYILLEKRKFCLFVRLISTTGQSSLDYTPETIIQC